MTEKFDWKRIKEREAKATKGPWIQNDPIVYPLRDNPIEPGKKFPPLARVSIDAWLASMQMYISVFWNLCIYNPAICYNVIKNY